MFFIYNIVIQYLTSSFTATGIQEELNFKFIAKQPIQYFWERHTHTHKGRRKAQNKNMEGNYVNQLN